MLPYVKSILLFHSFSEIKEDACANNLSNFSFSHIFDKLYALGCPD